jgi:hypothetical protein
MALTSLHCLQPLVPAGVQNLHTQLSICLSLELHRSFFSTQFPFYKNQIIPSSHVRQGLPLGPFPRFLACQAILGYLSPPILTTCPTHLICANSVLSLRGIIPNPILTL